MYFWASREHRKLPLRWVAITASHSSALILKRRLSSRISALLIRMTRRPKCSTTLVFIAGFVSVMDMVGTPLLSWVLLFVRHPGPGSPGDSTSHPPRSRKWGYALPSRARRARSRRAGTQAPRPYGAGDRTWGRHGHARSARHPLARRP